MAGPSFFMGQLDPVECGGVSCKETETCEI